MMKHFILIFLLVFSLKASAQQSFSDESLYHAAYQQLVGQTYVDISITNKGIFFRNTYLPGRVFFSSGDSIGGIFLRYSILEDKLIWLNKDHGQINLDRSTLKAFELLNGDTVFRFEKLALKTLNNSSDHFYQVLHSNKVSVYAERKVNKSSSYFSNKTQFFNYKPSATYILKIGQDEYLISTYKPRNLFKLFPDKKEKISQQLRDSNLKVDSEINFIRFIKSIEGILLGN